MWKSEEMEKQTTAGSIIPTAYPTDLLPTSVLLILLTTTNGR